MDEETLWQRVIECQSLQFYTASGLPFSYRVKVGKRGQLTKELLIDRREQSKTLTWSSIWAAYQKVLADCSGRKGWVLFQTKGHRGYPGHQLYLSASVVFRPHSGAGSGGGKNAAGRCTNHSGSPGGTELGFCLKCAA